MEKEIVNVTDLGMSPQNIIAYLSDSGEYIMRNKHSAAFFCCESLWLASWFENHFSLKLIDQAPGDLNCSLPKLAKMLEYISDTITAEVKSYYGYLISAFFYRRVNKEPSKMNVLEQ